MSFKKGNVSTSPLVAAHQNGQSVQQGLAEKMAEHDIRSWQAHDAKEPLRLMQEMARLYELEFLISYEDAMTTLEPYVTAAWCHDLAEMAHDSGNLAMAQKYWEAVKPNMVEHYSLLLKKMRRYPVGHIAEQIAHHDFLRWQVHHTRDFQSFIHHEASMYALLLDINYEDARQMAKYRGEAVWLHNQTNVIEDDVDEGEAAVYWNQAQKKLVTYYQTLLEAVYQTQQLTDWETKNQPQV